MVGGSGDGARREERLFRIFSKVFHLFDNFFFKSRRRPWSNCKLIEVGANWDSVGDLQFPDGRINFQFLRKFYHICINFKQNLNSQWNSNANSHHNEKIFSSDPLENILEIFPRFLFCWGKSKKVVYIL